MNSENQKPLAIGLEMPDGQWILEADGTLHFSNGNFLVGGAFGTRRKLVKRILIEDFTFIAEHVFEAFPECEEVIFKSAFVLISSMAFAHCPKLKNVYYADAEISEDAFRDTPYQASLQGIPFVPESEQELYIGGEAYGKKFLELMHQTTNEMAELKGPTPENYDWISDDRIWFKDCISAVLEGSRAGEAGMMFLFAELFHYSADFRYFYCTEEEQDTDSSHWYLEAAKACSPHAMLWCAWCSDEGVHGFAKDPLLSDTVLKSMPKIPKTLGLAELSFLKDDLLSLVEQAYDADREEDILGDQYHYDKEQYADLLPDPGWRTLHLRVIELSSMMVQMGLPYVLEEHGYDYRWGGDFQTMADMIKRDKNSLLEWCREKGMNINLV